MARSVTKNDYFSKSLNGQNLKGDHQIWYEEVSQ